jgi:hypothetical protein
MDELDNSALESITGVIANDTTLRWSCRQGDYLMWFRCHNAFANPSPYFKPLDMWEMRDGYFVTITNRLQDLPGWFQLHPTEVSEAMARDMQDQTPDEPLDGPNIWRLQAGDRVVWIGESRGEQAAVDGMLAILVCEECALALGETRRLPDNMWDIYGSIGEEGTSEEDIGKCRVALKAVTKLGLPRTMSTEWSLG